MAEVAVADRLLCLELFARYAWALDTHDVEAYVALFAPEGFTEMPGLGRFQGAARLREYGHSLTDDPRYKGRQHWCAQSVFEADGDAIRVKSYGSITYRNPETKETGILGTGYYLDRLVKVDGKWRFAERVWNRWEGDILKGFGQH